MYDDSSLISCRKSRLSYLGGMTSIASCSSGKRLKSLEGSQWSSGAEEMPQDSRLQSFAIDPRSLQSSNYVISGLELVILQGMESATHVSQQEQLQRFWTQHCALRKLLSVSLLSTGSSLVQVFCLESFAKENMLLLLSNVPYLVALLCLRPEALWSLDNKSISCIHSLEIKVSLVHVMWRTICISANACLSPRDAMSRCSTILASLPRKCRRSCALQDPFTKQKSSCWPNCEQALEGSGLLKIWVGNCI